MYQVTAIYEGSEVGYGEGEGYEYAAGECVDGVSDMYPAECVKLVCKHGVMEVETPMDLWLEMARRARFN